MSQQSTRNLPLDAMRVFLVFLVVTHHSVMAYLPEAPPVARSLIAAPRWWQAFPIVDTMKWSGFTLFVAFNDTFFMAALFLLSGLFVWKSLRRKGEKRFLRERVMRLGLPFLFCAFAIAPLAYYATYRQINTLHSSSGFWGQWLHLGVWPAGPAWFLWVLFTFDLFAAAIAAGLSIPVEAIAARLRADRPMRIFLGLTALSTACFAPMALHFGSMSWSSFGPFSIQTSRSFYYLAYFFAGMVLGATGLDTSLLQKNGCLARRWWLWIIASLVAFGLMVGLAIAAMQKPVGLSALGLAVSFAFCLSSAASTFALLAVFLRFVKGSGKVWSSLRESAFGMYVIHYAVVTWLQYWLWPLRMSALAKAPAVLVGALLLSWALVRVAQATRLTPLNQLLLQSDSL